ncbi:Uncharacterised protein [BD1-7 clade bacterium]|uniref:Uncharacterized protein n=1 Tax=BD1-7 clade bacterium TaxID=2029982 RepID=A0A5S9QVL3_9GAMM|nr:Uncharacterised protein [BD1-7 clade bacterium]
MKEIHYRVEVDAAGAKFIVLLNGYEVKLVSDGELCRVDRPVNPYIVNGQNRLELTVVPFSDESFFERQSSYVTAALVAYDPDGKLGEHGKVVSKLRYDYAVISGSAEISLEREGVFGYSSDENSEFSSIEFSREPLNLRKNYPVEGAVEISMDIGLETNFLPWKYLKSDTIPLVEDMTDEEFYDEFIPSIFRAYSSLHNALKQQDIDSIMPLFAERNAEMDSAFYCTPGTYEKQLRESFQRQFDKGMILADIDAGYVEGFVSENGKLAKLDDPYLIYFHDEEKSIFTGYDIWFRREDDKWIISR